MKVFISIIAGFVFFTQISAQEHFYYYKGEKIYLELNSDYIFISGTNKSRIQNISATNSINGMSPSNIKEDLTTNSLETSKRFKKSGSLRYWRELKLPSKVSKTNYKTEVEKLKKLNKDLIIAPYFKSKSIQKIGLTNYFYVKLKHKNEFNLLQELIARHKVELLGNNKFMPLWYTLSVTPNTLNAMEMANLFYETGLFEFAEPDLMVDQLLHSANSSASVPNDTYYSDQWHLNNTGQNGGTAGLDINTEEAWNITLGTNIRVAVIDEGFERDHPDLIDNNIGEGYDMLNGSSPSVTRGPHGTACAGIIGAKNNNNMGISGVAPESGLVSISGLGGTISSQQLANGINWAWQNNADVISNSWGTSPSSFIDDAINNALINGRNGLGTVVVFATGNSDYYLVGYPANSNYDILAVGAMNQCGERKSLVSCDGHSWGSNYGVELDIVAPGIFIPTTDLQRDTPIDYNPIEGDDPIYNYTDYNYHKTFWGTSAACPMVAGVAALVLSVNPNLTVKEVNNIIESSAQKVGSYSYQPTPGRINGTWNNEMGYGLVDAHQAVLLAQDNTPNPTPTCFDGIKNQGEMGVDCGFPCPPCVETNTCNFTITNFTNCEVQISWYDGVNVRAGANIPVSGYATELITDGDMWSANNTSDGSLLFPSFRVASCASPSGSVETALCNNQPTCSYNYIVSGIVSGLYQAENAVISPDSENDATVSANTSAIFDAGKFIDLKPGFTAAYNSRFDAFIDGCSSLRYGGNLFEENALKVHPNPLHNKGFVEFDLKESSVVEAFVTDITGKKVATLLNQESKQAGNHQVVFERKQLPAGIYLCTLLVGETIYTERFIITQ